MQDQDDLLEGEEEVYEEEAISRAVNLHMRVGVRFEDVETKILDIHRETGEVKFLSPMKGPRPRPVKTGTIIQAVVPMSDAGQEDIEIELVAMEQFQDTEDEAWYVIAEQDGLDWEDWLIRRREYVREKASFPVSFWLIEDDEKVFETNCENISGSGLKVILELEGVRDCPLNVDDEIALGLNMPPILDLEGRGILDQGDSHLELPPFAARVVRAHEIESRSIHTKRWAIGISYEYSEEDEDIEDYLIKYVLKLQIINEAAKRV